MVVEESVKLFFNNRFFDAKNRFVCFGSKFSYEDELANLFMHLARLDGIPFVDAGKSLVHNDLVVEAVQKQSFLKLLYQRACLILILEFLQRQ